MKIYIVIRDGGIDLTPSIEVFKTLESAKRYALRVAKELEFDNLEFTDNLQLTDGSENFITIEEKELFD